MSDTDTSRLRVITNNVPRDVIDAWQLTPDERAEFDYLNWDAIEAGNDSASFFRYKGELHDLGDFEGRPPEILKGWDGYQSDSFFSGIVVKYADDQFETVIVGTYIA